MPEVEVRAIAAGGDGVATLPDGRTVFVPRAAPGDTVRLRDVRLHARFARAAIAELVAAGPGRVTPPCPHYLADRCGGCQLMHLDVAAQRAWKARMVGDALRRIARLDLSDPEIVPATASLGYRTTITLTWADGRLGYHPQGQADRVFEVESCLLAEPALRELHAALRDARRELPREGARVVLRRDRTGGLHLVVRTEAGTPAWTGGPRLAQALADRGQHTAVWWYPAGGAPRVVTGGDVPWPATAFEQVHPAMADRVRADLLAGLGPVSGRHAWDLFAGIGVTTAMLAAAGATVESIEIDPRAVTLAERLGPPGPRRWAGSAESLVAELHSPAVIVTNPPRTGMPEPVSAAIKGSTAERIGYVSCDPATLARDLVRLAPTFRLASLRAYDQFPQTAHVESLAILERA